ncbi:MAG: AgmX/PglI C-terminal domain-containing protein [Bradymonadaceae bacterium]
MNKKPQEHEQSSSEKKTASTIRIVAVGLAATFAVVGISAAAALYANPDLLENFNFPSGVTGDLSGLFDDGARAGGNAAAGAPAGRGESGRSMADERPEYEGPTSAYIEEGADDRDVAFGFADGAQAGEEVLSNAAIQRVVNSRQMELVACYGEQLQEDPELEGRVDFEFAIAPDGHVAMVKVTGSALRSKAAEDCFVEKARHWQFPSIDSDIMTRFDTDFMFTWR